MGTNKIAMVVTSHAQLGSTGKATGYYLSEVAHPHAELKASGFRLDFISVRGGKPPRDPASDRDLDPVTRRFLEDPDALRLEATLPAAEAQPEDYDAILFAGGHGCMWDFAEQPTLAKLAESIYARGGIVATVCHGAAALVNLRTEQGGYLVKGKRVAAFTADEERAVGLESVVPFPLAARLSERGALHEPAPLWQPQVVVDGRLITGQNPASARGVARAISEVLLRRTSGVVVSLRLRARDVQALADHLLRVIPDTRRAEGCRYSHTYRSRTNPTELLLVQGWRSTADQERYLAWRRERGDLSELRALLTDDVVVEVLEPIEA